MGFNNFGFGFGFGWIFMIVFWGLIIWGIAAIIRGGLGHGCSHERHNHGHDNANENKALDILKERYAKGEISKGEFEERRKDLV